MATEVSCLDQNGLRSDSPENLSEKTKTLVQEWLNLDKVGSS